MTQENPQENSVDRYTILRELGRGAIGTVYAARDRSTGAAVALKTLDPALFSEPNSKLAELFLKNALSARRLRHRNIVRIFDAAEAGGAAYVAMELVEGESLRTMLDDRPLSIARAIQIFDDIASALAYAHEEGMVHRGVKPSNIIVSRSGVAKIGDFGTGQIGAAALRYMSPEQVRHGPVDHRSDLFSLGAVFYEMLTRRAAFEGNSPEQIRENILRAEPPRPSEVNPNVPSALDGMVLRMLAGHPDGRFANARILLRDLQRFEEGLGLRPGASAGEPTASGPELAPRTPDLGLRTPEPGLHTPEPRLRTPEPNRFRDPAPAQEAPRFARHDQARDASGLGFPPAPSAAEAFQHRSQIPAGRAFHEQDARFMRDRVREPEPSSGSRTALFSALALMLAMLSIGLTLFLYYSPDTIERLILASRTQQAPATAAAPSPSTAPPPSQSAAPPQSPPTAPPPVAEAQKPAPAPAAREASPPRAAGDARPAESSAIASAPNPLPSKPLAAEPSPPAQTESLPTREPEQSATGATAPPQEAPPAPRPTANIPQSQPRGTAKLILAVSPRGELYLDGEHYGTTPPITTLNLEPGMHRIEIRSGSRKPYLTYMTVEAGDQRRIRHDFGAKPSRPPS